MLKDENGATAVEFGMVAMPFLLFVLGILGMGLYYLALISLEYGVESAARKIRTGEAEKSALTVGGFKSLICASAIGIDCSKVTVIIKHAKTWTGIEPQACVTNNSQTGSSGNVGDALSDYSGSASEVVLVTACYRWALADSFKFMKFSASGPTIIQAATAFKNEPYN
ncbi:TadE/TadG family type IV pilus assembly protein [Hyphomicrobium album]|uniref:TadE/TadG family type IV pilus assembly protein n=1 Tax=Hyphomicrobium album TaxID=2665159 RepID=UPI0018AB35B1|nr:TadE/TadG family type IV pilus assembly protein [Hyphomicrobium album]